MEELREPFLSSSSQSFQEEINEESSMSRCNQSRRNKPVQDTLSSMIPSSRHEKENALYMRALVTASQRGNHTSIILKVPFLFTSVVVGLWPSKGVPSACIVILGILINIYVVIGDIFVGEVCKVLPNNTADKLSPWLCYGGSKINNTRKVWAKLFQPMLWERFIFNFAQLSGYVLMAYCVLKTLPRTQHAISLNKAFTMLTRKHWIHLNLQILIFFIVWVTYMASNIYLLSEYFPNDKRSIFVEIENALFWLYFGTPCWIFAVMTNALESLVDASFDEIKAVRAGNINDVIKVYNQLCKHVFSTTRALRYWFVVHWFAFGTVFVVDTAIGVDIFVKKENPFIFWAFGITVYFCAFYPFLYPSVCAAHFTSKCGDLLERLDVLEPKDWHEDHPLRHRRNMNEFLLFANQVQCGFRVGRMNFNNGLAWLSLFFEVFGLILRLV